MRRAPGTPLLAAFLAAVPLCGCAVHDSRLAERAQTRLIGVPELDLETCFGAPDQRTSVGATDILTWYASSSSSISYSLPLIQGPSLSNGGYCHVTVRFDDRRATRVVYTGEKNALFAPDAYCAPVLRTCLAMLGALARQSGSAVAPTDVRPLRAGS